MRRTLFLFTALLIGAIAMASAQARTHIGVRLQQQNGGPPNLVFSVTNLLDDPEWLDQLNSASRLQLHWTVSLSKAGAVFDQTGTPREWNDYVEKIPTLDIYNFIEPSGGRLTLKSFPTLDSLKEHLGLEQVILTSRSLAPGRWYYTVDLTVSIDDQHGPDGKTAPLSGFQRLILGSGPKRSYAPQTTATFVVPNH